MLKAREITKTNQNKSYYNGRNEINQNGVVCTQQKQKQIISLLVKFWLHSENSLVAKFRYIAKICYVEKFRYIAKFSACSEIFTADIVHQCWLLFHCSQLLLFALHYSISSCFDILHSQLVEIDRKPYEIDGNQPDIVMIGLTR